MDFAESNGEDVAVTIPCPRRVASLCAPPLRPGPEGQKVGIETGQRSGQIVILNGAPRSGKSSIAGAIQEMGDGVWMNLGVDGFMAMTPKQYLPGIGLRPGGERPDLEPIVRGMYLALYDSIAAHTRMGLNVVVDVGHHDAYSKPMAILPGCARRLQGLPVLFVGVRCPASVVMERRKATGWEADGSPDSPVRQRVEMWEREVHRPGVYDLEVDTSTMSPGQCANVIRGRLAGGPAPTVFQRLAALCDGAI